jgi:hypothetical protein
VRNNIFALGGEAQLMRTRAEEPFSFTLERNIIAANDAADLRLQLDGLKTSS